MPSGSPADRCVLVWRSLMLPGSETFIRNQADALPSWRPVFLGALRVPSPLARADDVIAFPGSQRGTGAFFALRATGGSRRLRRLVSGLRPDVVHAHLAGDGWLISRTAYRLGIPLVITLHGRDVTVQAAQPGRRGARYRRNLRTAFDRAGVILAVSGYIRDRAIALGADPAKVRVHHTGVPMPAGPAAVEPEWDIVFVGRFVAKKGIDDLIEAVAMMPDLRPRMLFIGDGPLEPAMRTLAAERGLAATFLGAQDSGTVGDWLAVSKMFVAPSKTGPDGDTEGLPTTILEAASRGLPVVSTRHSGIPEAVVHGVTGLLGAEGDRIALARHIRALLTDDDLRERLGRQARQHMLEHFDIRTQSRLLEDVYTEVAAATPCPAVPAG
jgi:colanic acid/amylovoran biosynthesis glycosyltransferase